MTRDKTFVDSHTELSLTIFYSKARFEVLAHDRCVLEVKVVLFKIYLHVTEIYSNI